jgi:hypothetical protein
VDVLHLQLPADLDPALRADLTADPRGTLRRNGIEVADDTVVEFDDELDETDMAGAVGGVKKPLDRPDPEWTRVEVLGVTIGWLQVDMTGKPRSGHLIGEVL